MLVAGEPGGGEPAFRAKLEEGWGARVTEAMGIGDIGVSLWGECEEQDGMHLGARGFVHAELIDPETGAAVELEDGATGELVLTHLQHRAAPLLRFRTRDHVQVRTGPCSCGRTGPRVRCIGRTDDMLIVRGVNVFPSAVREVVSAFAPEVSGHILVKPRAPGVKQEPPLPVSVELARDATADAALAEAIRERLRNVLVVQTRVELVPWGSLRRSEYKSKLVERSTRDQEDHMAAITLNILKPSVNNLTARIFVRAAGLDFEEQDVWGKKTSPEFLEKYPAHLTPMLEEEGLPRGSLGESCAIMQYLCNKHGLDQFYPTRPGRARDGRQRDVLPDRHLLSAAHAGHLPGARLPAVPGRGRDVRRRRRHEGEGAAGRRGRARRAARRLRTLLPGRKALHRRRLALDRRHSPGRDARVPERDRLRPSRPGRGSTWPRWSRPSARPTPSPPQTCAGTSPP